MKLGKLDRSTLKLPLALSGGRHATLADFAGHWLVLYFYPKDSTPGCTTEGLDFNALLPEFRKLNASVLGVSRDSVKSHDNFCAKQGFSFALVSDAVASDFCAAQPQGLHSSPSDISIPTNAIDAAGPTASVAPWQGHLWLMGGDSDFM